MNFIKNDINDNPAFLINCEKIIANRIKLWKPQELFIISIQDIFESGWAENPKENVFSFWTLGEELIINQFLPNLINSISIYNDSYKGNYIENTIENYIKKRKKGEYRLFQFDSSILKSYVFPQIENVLLVWYSKKSLSNNEGTIMIFYKDTIQLKSLHITLSENINWNASESFGISKSEIQTILE